MTTVTDSLFILSGPSGAGEDSIIERLSKTLPITVVKTTTTRPMRRGESQGFPYHFISQEEFEMRIKANSFCEYARHYNGQYYGVSREEIDRVIASGTIGIWKIDWKGVEKAKKLFPGIKAIFIDAESDEVLEKRIRRRGGVSDAYVKERMEYTKQWRKHLDIYDHTVVNKEGCLAEAVEKIREIICRQVPRRCLPRS